MKRFCASLILLALTIAVAVGTQYKTVTLTNDLLHIIREETPPQTVVQWWDENGAWLMALLPHAQIEEIQAAVASLPADAAISDAWYRLRRAELAQTVETLRDSLEFNLQNIL